MDKNAVDFLLRANKAAYAGKGAEAYSSRPSSHDFHYEDGTLKYIDTYLGRTKFSGETALWEGDAPFWSINYVGRIVSDNFSDDFLRETYDFLKEVLLLAPKEYPYRGPSEYANGDYSYKCTVKGDIDWFYGYEQIFFRDEMVFECAFHGGDIAQ
ncbi:MAG: DUF5680 domain-containing protein [Oscillospiraceae bacterium]|jgi:hypothetical protein|nr:DUF5680 domain-containing protein [Oscillospiraceae bacterium]